jgi:hypothetical protein
MQSWSFSDVDCFRFLIVRTRNYPHLRKRSGGNTVLRVNDYICVMSSKFAVRRRHAAVILNHHEFRDSLRNGLEQFHGIASHPPDLGAK